MAIEHYLEAEQKGRLIQSLKSYLTSRTLTSTEVFGRRYSVEELIARILTDLRLNAERQFGEPVRHVTVGRPVRFVGADSPEDDDFAVERLRKAFLSAGFDSVTFEMEPIAAAYAYESTLDRDELILIGDFGGGTSDFSLLHVGPGVRARGRTAKDLLGNSGLGLAGDSFDARIVRKLVSPALGSDSFERSYAQANDRPPNIIPAVPAWIYANLERWHYLSFLKTRNVAEILKSARARAQEPEKIEALINLIEEDLGYQLHQAVQRLKIELSRQEAAEFWFRDGSMDIVAEVRRTDFEGWIAEELQSIERCVDGLLASKQHRCPRGRPRLPDRRHQLCACGAPHLREALYRRARPHRQRVHFSRTRSGVKGSGTRPELAWLRGHQESGIARAFQSAPSSASTAPSITFTADADFFSEKIIADRTSALCSSTPPV